MLIETESGDSEDPFTDTNYFTSLKRMLDLRRLCVRAKVVRSIPSLDQEVRDFLLKDPPPRWKDVEYKFKKKLAALGIGCAASKS